MNNILITGVPGVGKTTLITKIIARLKRYRLGGFITKEVREAGSRVGFELVGLDGVRGVLSHVDFKGKKRVGKYGVDVDGFEKMLDSVGLERGSLEVAVIDEIGKMECFSRSFRSKVLGLLNSNVLLIATVSLSGSGLISEIKKRKDIRLFQVERENRDRVVDEIMDEVELVLVPDGR